MLIKIYRDACRCVVTKVIIELLLTYSNVRVCVTSGKAPRPLTTSIGRWEMQSLWGATWRKVVAPMAIFACSALSQNVRHFADNTFKRIFLYKWVLINMSLKFFPKCLINNFLSLVNIMAWRRLDDKPLFEPLIFTLLRHLCVIQPQWVKSRITKLTMSIHY